MRVLLLHPEISSVNGSWTREHWDLIVDLGYAGRPTYAEWSQRFNTRVLSIHEYGTDLESYRWVNEVFNHGRGKLLDRMGLDWWDLLVVGSYFDLHVLWLFQRLGAEISQPVELWAVRSHRFIRMAEQVFGQCRYAQRGREGPARRILLAWRSARNLRPLQIVEVAFDKWDPGYRIRRHWPHQSPAGITEPVMLLPSAYTNVTRSALAYATQLPDRKFLLATTRHSAIPDRLPANVTMVPLAAYAMSSTAVVEEATELSRAWHEFSRIVASQYSDFKSAIDAGLWDFVPAQFEQGLRLRNAWQHLLDTEPVTGVLCGDDLNYHTRLPLRLARRSGRPAGYCSHGALDGGFLVKTAIADYYLVKGEMERDYLLQVSAIPVEKILVGAPETTGIVNAENGRGEAILFFSQPYEVSCGRADSIYREILPPLYSAALRSGRKLVVKLHPFESQRGRKKLVDSILQRQAGGEVEVVKGTPPEEVMARAWCGVTVDSSVAVECALRKIPFFLCGWLDFTGLGYLQQFARFGVAEVLKSPEELLQIPEKVADYRPNLENLHRLWQPADPNQLDKIMSATRPARVDTCVC